MTRSVVYSPRARDHLTDLYLWIAVESGFPDHADGYTSAILDFCDALAELPYVGTARDDLRPGIRTVGFRRRAVIAFVVTDTRIDILGVYYGGRDYETLILADGD